MYNKLFITTNDTERKNIKEVAALTELKYVLFRLLVLSSFGATDSFFFSFLLDSAWEALLLLAAAFMVKWCPVVHFPDWSTQLLPPKRKSRDGISIFTAFTKQLKLSTWITHWLFVALLAGASKNAAWPESTHSKQWRHFWRTRKHCV